MKTFDEWVEHYNKHSGEVFREHDGCKMFFIPDRGFCELRFCEDLLIFYQLSGDAKFWHDFGLVLCGIMGLKAMGTICTRNIKAYLRWWNYRITKEVKLKEGVQYFAEHKEHKWKVRCSPAWNKETGDTAYYVTEYLEVEE